MLDILDRCAWCEGDEPVHVMTSPVPESPPVRYGICKDCLQTRLIDKGWTEDSDRFHSPDPRAKFLRGPGIEYYRLRPPDWST